MFRMTKCVTVSDAAEKERIIQLFVEHKIPYRIKAENANQMNAFGSIISVNSVRMTYTFYVKKEDIDYALSLIKSH